MNSLEKLDLEAAELLQIYVKKAEIISNTKTSDIEHYIKPPETDFEGNRALKFGLFLLLTLSDDENVKAIQMFFKKKTLRKQQYFNSKKNKGEVNWNKVTTISPCSEKDRVIEGELGDVQG